MVTVFPKAYEKPIFKYLTKLTISYSNPLHSLSPLSIVNNPTKHFPLADSLCTKLSHKCLPSPQTFPVIFPPVNSAGSNYDCSQTAIYVIHCIVQEIPRSSYYHGLQILLLKNQIKKQRNNNFQNYISIKLGGAQDDSACKSTYHKT